MKGILKNTPAGWYVWYSVMRDEITSGYDSIPVYQETFDFNGKQPIIPLVEGKQVEFKIEDFWETGGDEGIKLAKLIIPKEEPKDVVLGYKTSLDAQMLDKVEPKRETLEEFIKKSYLSRLQDCLSVDFADGIKVGVKWQEERMYSEEEVIEFTMNMISQYVVGNTNIWDRDRLKETLLLKKL
jgi:hypothetical protein